MKRYRVGLIGVSRGAQILRAVANHPQCEIVALCARRRETLEPLAKELGVADGGLYTDFDAFVGADMDVAVIATPIELHADQTVALMEAGKHVLCELSMAYTLEDCQRVVEVTRRTGRMYMLAENYSYYHYVQEWKRLIQAGRLGKVYHAEGEYLQEITRLLRDPVTGERTWRYDRAPLLYSAHALGPLMYLMENRVVRATGLTSGKTMFPREEGNGFLDMETGLFQTAKGSVVKVLVSQTARRYRAPGGGLTWYCLYGTKGFVENGRDPLDQGLEWLEDVDTKTGGARHVSTPTADPNAPPGAKGAVHGTGDYTMVSDFIRALDSGEAPFFDVVRGAQITAAGIIAHQAALQGGVWLDVPDFQ